MKETVKYHNDFSTLELKNFGSKELDILMAILSKCKNQGQNLVTLTFKEIQELSKFKEKNKKNLAIKIRTINKKLLSMNMMLRDAENPGTTVQFVLFNRFVTSEENQTLEIKVNENFEYLLNSFTRNFSSFDLEDFVAVKSFYSKKCFFHLKRFSSTGIWSVSIEDFRTLLGIPSSYRCSHLESIVLRPIQNELSGYFKGLKVKKIYSSFRGNALVRLEFSFAPNLAASSKNDIRKTRFKCPECGNILIEKMINGSNCWCHPDGWKNNAQCNKIYNSVAEIQGFSEFPNADDSEKSNIGLESLSDTFSRILQSRG